MGPYALSTQEDPNSNSQGWPYSEEAKTRNQEAGNHTTQGSGFESAEVPQQTGHWPAGVCSVAQAVFQNGACVPGQHITTAGGSRQLQGGPWCKTKLAATRGNATSPERLQKDKTVARGHKARTPQNQHLIQEHPTSNWDPTPPQAASLEPKTFRQFPTPPRCRTRAAEWGTCTRRCDDRHY